MTATDGEGPLRATQGGPLDTFSLAANVPELPRPLQTQLNILKIAEAEERKLLRGLVGLTKAHL
jgi:hypothetical protein